MVAFSARKPSDLHSRVLAILPRIETHAQIYFRHIKSQVEKEEAIAETVALAWKWYVRLVRRGKDVSGFVSTFASYPARAVKCGRRVFGMERAKDVLSSRAQQRHGFTVDKLPDISTLSDNPYSEPLADNTRTPPPEAAAFRIDWPAWLRTRTRRDRRVIRDMALGERTKHLAHKHKLSPARISQLRREYAEDWQRFTANEAVPA